MTNGQNLELNQGDNFIFGFDVSGSMDTKDCAGGVSRIEFAKEKANQFVTEASKYDTDGIDLITFGHKINDKDYLGITADKAAEIIGGLKATESLTDTAGLIRAAYARHKALASEDQTVLFIVTDGEPTDQKAVQDEIVKITNDVKDEREFNISFLTVGVRTPKLETFLTGLDDDLKGAKFDIVDVKRLEDVDFLTAFIGALND